MSRQAPSETRQTHVRDWQWWDWQKQARSKRSNAPKFQAKDFLRIAAVLALTSLLLGCGAFRGPSINKSSLVEYLYPDSSKRVETPRIPQLALPLRVGVAFTPTAYAGLSGFPENEKSALAEQVVAKFRDLDFVSSIEIIPTDYLRPHGGFANVEQLKQLFNIDVIVLLSYDQSVFTDEGLASLAYWTIVGAYIVPGEKNDTQTLIDAAVFDINSRALLFRAPGTSVVKSRSTLVANQEQLREDSIEGFSLAGEQLSINLATELDRFKLRVKEAPDQFVITTREGYSGGGSSDLVLLLLSVLLAAVLLPGRKKRAHA